VLHLGAFELDEDDRLLRAEKIVEDAEDFEIEFSTWSPAKMV